MKERPIIFNADMVRAILEGRKTQTRRPMEPQPEDVYEEETDINGDPNDSLKYFPMKRVEGAFGSNIDYNNELLCPYGQPGDRLWVKEAWAPARFSSDHPNYAFRADGEFEGVAQWYPAIQMCRLASRITLEITSVRVERLHNTSDKDLIAEGVALPFEGTIGWKLDAAEKFIKSWNSDNAQKGFGWDANPWVWVVEFKRIDR